MGFLSPSQPQIIQQEPYVPPAAPAAPPTPTPTPASTPAAPDDSWKETAAEKGWTPPEDTAKPDDTQYEDPRINQAAEEQRVVERNRKGRRSTILTGGQGLVDEPTVQKKTLLGA